MTSTGVTAPDKAVRTRPPAGDCADGLARETARAGFTCLRRDRIRHLLAADALEDFRAAWEDLELDTGIPGGKLFRLRRYGRLRVEVEADGTASFTPLPHASFRQDVIHMWRGQDRVFAPIAPEVLLHEGMLALVGLDARAAARLSGTTSWEVGVHLIRILAEPGGEGEPTPEGRHRDGHAYVGMHLLRRDRCGGGLSTVHPEGGEPVRLTLLDPLDSMFVDDARVTHEVSPISPLDGTAVRDMLLVDLNPAVAAGG
ncbi:2OG-Fe dioxygenase family protein [Streptomyces flavotricini]|uniref:2OG-Fe dioxygenase family protein n=1 Tax=Streptomyces flavotricini TaxID=66888 RepID=A0ABS8EH90_9ACTN|nr:2OG-Fe dioxygenase family protein [Streptomyces flavotricini]MCC0100059.1 2OG-Fe dioxygenase family protein [Streptomyces flavotricini]